jgi:hypothetical protein
MNAAGSDLIWPVVRVTIACCLPPYVTDDLLSTLATATPGRRRRALTHGRYPVVGSRPSTATRSALPIATPADLFTAEPRVGGEIRNDTFCPLLYRTRHVPWDHVPMPRSRATPSGPAADRPARGTLRALVRIVARQDRRWPSQRSREDAAVLEPSRMADSRCRTSVAVIGARDRLIAARPIHTQAVACIDPAALRDGPAGDRRPVL